MVGYSEGVDIVEQAFTALFGFWIIGWLLHLLTDHTGRWRFGWHPLSRPSIRCSPNHWSIDGSDKWRYLY